MIVLGYSLTVKTTFISLRAEDSQLDEWSIMEIQGDLEADDDKSLANKFLADLHFDKNGVPILIIGHHVMYGKIINLEKPMVLMQKVRKAANRQVLMDEDELTSQKIETEPESTKDQTKLKTEYVVKAIIRKKILFNKRPRPIVY